MSSEKATPLSSDVERRLDAFRDYIASRKSPATGDAYRRGARRFEQFLVEREMDVIYGAPGLPDEYVGWMQAQRLSATTIGLMSVGAQVYLEWRRKQGEQIPVFVKPDLPRPEFHEPVVLETEVLRGFFREAAQKPEPFRTVLLLMPLCGLRSEEMVRLKLEDLTTQEGVVYFHVLGKGRKKRVVPLLREGNKVLRKYLSTWRAGRRYSDLLFPSIRGNHPVSTRGLRMHVEAISEAVGFDFSPHNLRKTYSTMCDAAGMSPFAVAQLLGHKKIETTGTHYVQHRPADLARGLSSVKVQPPDEDDEE